MRVFVQRQADDKGRDKKQKLTNRFLGDSHGEVLSAEPPTPKELVKIQKSDAWAVQNVRKSLLALMNRVTSCEKLSQVDGTAWEIEIMSGPPQGAPKDPAVDTRFQEILRKSVEIGASDIHIKTGLPPVVRVNDDLRLLSRKIPALGMEEVKKLVEDILPARLRPQYVAGREIDMAYSFSGVGRFRLNIYRYRSQIGIVARYIPFEVRSFDQLQLPAALKKISQLERGLILVTGAAGNGKSTTLAAFLNEWNQTRGGHIITIEDPVEYLVRDRKSIITQREVGLDTESFGSGLKNALRQDPDVIMIGELRDRETIQTALSAAESGHLVLSTLHTKDSMETVSRIIGVFEPEVEREIRHQFSSSLAAIISQRLVSLAPDASGRVPGRFPAIEILINTPRIRDLLRDGTKNDQIREAIEAGVDLYGMQSFDQHLMALFRKNMITRETAIRNASNPADFELRLRGIHGADAGRWSGVKEGPPEKADHEMVGDSLELDDIYKKS